MAARAVAALRSPGKVVDPIIEPFVGQRSWQYAWRTRLHTRKSNAKSAKAIGKAQGLIAGFSKDRIERESKDLFTEFHKAYADADVPYLRQLVTDPYLRAVRKGISNTVARTGCYLGMDIVELLSLPELVQARQVFDKPEAMVGYFENPDYFQMTLRITSLQLPTSRPATDGGAAVGAKGAKGGKRGRAKPRATPKLQVEGEWRPAFDADGRVYYWHTGADVASTWKLPVTLGDVGAVPVLVDEMGVVREVVESDTHGQLMKVVNYVTLERSVRESDEWMICHV